MVSEEVLIFPTGFPWLSCRFSHGGRDRTTCSRPGLTPRQTKQQHDDLESRSIGSREMLLATVVVGKKWMTKWSRMRVAVSRDRKSLRWTSALITAAGNRIPLLALQLVCLPRPSYFPFGRILTTTHAHVTASFGAEFTG